MSGFTARRRRALPSDWPCQMLLISSPATSSYKNELGLETIDGNNDTCGVRTHASEDSGT
jgi:hypothetical protein